MHDFIHSPEVDKYATDIAADSTLFLEGDESSDLYILVHGSLDVYKGQKLISNITEPGQIFGEMSYLLGEQRSATIKVHDPARVIRIPGDRVIQFLHEFPMLAPEITKVLARRLQETTEVVHGLKELCDQLPDAVIMTDKHQNILAWNKAAEKLYGRPWSQMQDQTLGEIYEDQDAFRQFVKEMQDSPEVKEKVMAINHPLKENSLVSTSTTVLYDGHNNIQGYILLGRDVTTDQEMKKKYLMIRYWLIPALVLVVLLSATVFVTFPKFSKGSQILDHKSQSFRNRIVEDLRRLTSSVGPAFAGNDLETVDTRLAEYFRDPEPLGFGITGLVLLDNEKNVVDAYAGLKGGRADDLVGTSYKGINFKGKDKIPHRVLTLFRITADHPMGAQGTELAFPLSQQGKAGWLIFQLDMELLSREFGLELKKLEQIEFDGISRGAPPSASGTGAL